MTYLAILFQQNLLPAIFAHLPAGASVNQVIHYAQIIKSGKMLKV